MKTPATKNATPLNPPLTGSDAIMDPWTYTEADVRNIAALGYKYV